MKRAGLGDSTSRDRNLGEMDYHKREKLMLRSRVVDTKGNFCGGWGFPHQLRILILPNLAFERIQKLFTKFW